jgi:hypothetical protein
MSGYVVIKYAITNQLGNSVMVAGGGGYSFLTYLSNSNASGHIFKDDVTLLFSSSAIPS